MKNWIEIEKKEEGEKLLRLKIIFSDEQIKDIQIGGDFFIYPEDFIDSMENFLKKIEINKFDKLLVDLREFIELNYAELIGISAETIAIAIFEAKNNDGF